MGVIEAGAVGGASRGAGYFISPLGKANLFIAGIFLFVFIFTGINHSVQEKSLYPLFHETLERVIASDVHLGQQIDKLVDGSAPPKPAGLFYQGTAKYVYYWIGWWFTTAGCFFMMYFFVWLLYGFWTLVSHDSVLKNVLLTAVTYLIIGLISGMILFVMGLAGKSLPDDRNLIFDKLMVNSFPFHGTVKFVGYFLNGGVMESAYSWAQTPVGGAVSGFESGSSVNKTLSGVNVSG